MQMWPDKRKKKGEDIVNVYRKWFSRLLFMRTALTGFISTETLLSRKFTLVYTKSDW